MDGALKLDNDLVEVILAKHREVHFNLSRSGASSDAQLRQGVNTAELLGGHNMRGFGY